MSKFLESLKFSRCEVRINTTTSAFLVKKITAQIESAASIEELNQIDKQIDRYVNVGVLHWTNRLDLNELAFSKMMKMGYKSF